MRFSAMSSSLSQAGAPKTSDVPNWETAAGGKMSFDVVSVKRNISHSDAVRRNFPWTMTTEVPQTGGLFLATNIPLYG